MNILDDDIICCHSVYWHIFKGLLRVKDSKQTSEGTGNHMLKRNFGINFKSLFEIPEWNINRKIGHPLKKNKMYIHKKKNTPKCLLSAKKILFECVWMYYHTFMKKINKKKRMYILNLIKGFHIKENSMLNLIFRHLIQFCGVEQRPYLYVSLCKQYKYFYLQHIDKYTGTETVA